MFWTKLKRVSGAGAMAVWRNGVVSFAAGLVMTVTLFVLGSLLIGSALLDSTIVQIKDKVDINVYFKLDAKEEDMRAMKKALEGLPEVSAVEYISRDEALADFKERHKDNSLIVASLEELADNPLGASLNVKAKQPSQYEGVAKFLDESAALGKGGVSIIDKVTFNQNKASINKLAQIIDAADRFGAFIILLFSIIALLVTVITIRLAIYASREEIAIMKLVGASNNYVRGPFVISGALYGISAAVLSTLLLWPLTSWITRSTGDFFGALNVSSYYVANLGQIFFLLLGVGVILGVISSLLAIHRYLRV